MSDRFTRQRRLREVGDAGQRLIEAARVEISDAPGADVQRAYLERAGVAAVVVRPGLGEAPFPHAGSFRFDAAREVGGGAWRALHHLRAILGIAGPPPGEAAPNEVVP